MSLCCRSEPDGKLLYILPNALTADSMAEGPQGAGKAPVPPCIMSIGNDTTQISLDIDDRCVHPAEQAACCSETGKRTQLEVSAVSGVKGICRASVLGLVSIVSWI